jgi:hypothetical protein
MTALPTAVATRNGFLTTAKALERALRQAEFDRPATDSAPFHSRALRHLPVRPSRCFG